MNLMPRLFSMHRHSSSRAASQTMSVDRRTFFGLFIILTSFAIGTAHGGPVTVTGISGVFSNPVLTGDVIEPYGPPTFFDNTATAESAYEAGGCR